MNTETFRVDRMDRTVAAKDFVKECVDVAHFLPYCQQCTNYGRTWACPPFDFDPMELWGRYETVHLYAYKIHIPEELREKEYHKEEKNRILKEIMMGWKKTFDLEMMELEKDGAMSLSGGTCMKCAPGTCTRLTGEPCRYPDQLRYSIEALGGDVGKTVMTYFDEELLWMNNGKLQAYFMLVGGILIP